MQLGGGSSALAGPSACWSLTAGPAPSVALAQGLIFSLLPFPHPPTFLTGSLPPLSSLNTSLLVPKCSPFCRLGHLQARHGCKGCTCTNHFLTTTAYADTQGPLTQKGGPGSGRVDWNQAGEAGPRSPGWLAAGRWPSPRSKGATEGTDSQAKLRLLALNPPRQSGRTRSPRRKTSFSKNAEVWRWALGLGALRFSERRARRPRLQREPDPQAPASGLASHCGLEAGLRSAPQPRHPGGPSRRAPHQPPSPAAASHFPALKPTSSPGTVGGSSGSPA